MSVLIEGASSRCLNAPPLCTYADAYHNMSKHYPYRGASGLWMTAPNKTSLLLLFEACTNHHHTLFIHSMFRVPCYYYVYERSRFA